MPSAYRKVCLPSDRGGVGPAEGGGASVRSSLRACCAASAPHQQHVRGMAGCSGRSSHPYCVRNTAAEAGRCGLYPTSEGGVRARGFPVACRSGAVSLWLELSGTNNTFGQCDDAGDPCVCELREVGRLLGFRITSFVPGYAAVANDTLHPCARSSALRERQNGTSTM
ncbi:hypothetical protein TcG_09255 [Trypanosoma cruzi]|nr:hypothetical protein TcG_09255 [Trypanosoma cruzi]